MSTPMNYEFKQTPAPVSGGTMYIICHQCGQTMNPQEYVMHLPECNMLQHPENFRQRE